ncbi:MAG: low molecular weight protein arginine phosphatase [Heliobacteriaceae bacterium]|nr:low molecular weight protein arginine phosphatase [Heliobacteriaceae bacterium]MDD4587845.1 low molecular weight protein arginine phosphatase [Heliobacteriaceae bacterium]
MFTLLFVCTGNTCRSAMARVITEALLAEQGLDRQVKVLSAGTAAWPGAPASEQAQAVLAVKGLSLAGHRADLVTPELLGQADLVLVMTGRQRDWLVALAPDQAGKIHLLKGYAGETGDVVDPIGGDEPIYLACAAEIKGAVAKILTRLPLK